MGERYEIVMAGTGGQGIVLAGMILGEAIVLYEGKNVVQTESYGIATRGGYSRSEIVISPKPVLFPKVMDPDLVLAFTQDAYVRCKNLKPSSLLLYDNQISTENHQSGAREKGIPFTKTTQQFLEGKAINILALGVVAELTGVVSKEALEKVVISKAPRFKDINLAALKRGFSLAL